MNLKQAAEMALEALEWNYGTDLCDIENCTAWLDKMNATIPALRQALAMENFSEVNQELEQALAQEQEPVAWMHIFSDGNSHCVTKNESSFIDKFTGTYKTVPLYTAPPKREWVGLTDEEIIDLGADNSIDIAWAHEIEAKLKEKNT